MNAAPQLASQPTAVACSQKGCPFPSVPGKEVCFHHAAMFSNPLIRPQSVNLKDTAIRDHLGSHTKVQVAQTERKTRADYERWKWLREKIAAGEETITAKVPFDTRAQDYANSIREILAVSQESREFLWSVACDDLQAVIQKIGLRRDTRNEDSSLPKLPPTRSVQPKEDGTRCAARVNTGLACTRAAVFGDLCALHHKVRKVDIVIVDGSPTPPTVNPKTGLKDWTSVAEFASNLSIGQAFDLDIPESDAPDVFQNNLRSVLCMNARTHLCKWSVIRSGEYRLRIAKTGVWDAIAVERSETKTVTTEVVESTRAIAVSHQPEQSQPPTVVDALPALTPSSELLPAKTLHHERLIAATVRYFTGGTLSDEEYAELAEKTLPYLASQVRVYDEAKSETETALRDWSSKHLMDNPQALRDLYMVVHEMLRSILWDFDDNNPNAGTRKPATTEVE